MMILNGVIRSTEPIAGGAGLFIAGIIAGMTLRAWFVGTEIAGRTIQRPIRRMEIAVDHDGISRIGGDVLDGDSAIFRGGDHGARRLIQ